jgi:hypothetical protein
VSERLSINELPPSTVWALRELGLVSADGSVDREHVRTLGEFLVRFDSARPAVAGAPVAGEPRPVRTRTRTKPTKAEVRAELTGRIADHLREHPGSTIEEVADALGAPVPDVTLAARPVDWLVLQADELTEPSARVESDAIIATRDRARAALQAAHLLATPLSHQAYTTLIREGRVKGPSVARIVQLFGSWTAACNEVGVTSGEPLRSNYERTWTAEDLLTYVARFLMVPGYRGASHQFDIWRSTIKADERVPSLGTVRNILGGSWNDIRRMTLRQMRAKWAG